MKSVEGRKEEKGEEIKGQAIRPFVVEKRRAKRIRCLKIIILSACGWISFILLKIKNLLLKIIKK